MFCAAADGKIVPLYTVYKSTYLYPTWMDGVSGARFNSNSSGWFDMSIFEDWFSLSFIPFIKNSNGPKFIIGDNLASHLSLEVIKLCATHNITFV